MIITNTHTVQGYEISEYQEIVFGEVIAGINIFKDFAAGIKDIFGGRSKSYEDEIKAARDSAMKEMIKNAEQLNADAVVGVKLNYQVMGQANAMMMVVASGTAVKLKKA